MSFKDSIKSAYYGTKLKIEQNSPEILLVSGIIGVVGTIVLACRATVKSQEVLEEAKYDLQYTHDDAEALQIDEQTEKKEILTTYVRTGWKLTKLYVPAALVGGLSIASLTGSHCILKNRNNQLALAYAGLDAFLQDYRGRVKEKIGENEEYKVYNGLESEIVKEKVTDEDGKVTTVKKEVLKLKDPNKLPPHTYMFDEMNAPNTFSKIVWENNTFLNAITNGLCDRLVMQHFMTENDILASYGLPLVEDGYDWCLVWNPKNYDEQDTVDVGLKEALEVINDYDSDGSAYRCPGILLRIANLRPTKDYIAKSQTW